RAASSRSHAAAAAAGRTVAAGSALLLVAAAARGVAGRARRVEALRAVWLSIRGDCLALLAERGLARRRNGAGQDHAGDYRHSPLDAERPGPSRAVDLSQAADSQLATGIQAVGRRAAGDSARRGR